jgi:hypothetical protein
MAMVFALFGKIPFIGEFLFAIPYLLYFFGAVFTIYTFIVLLVSFIYTPAIVGTLEEDTMGTVFQNYSVTWSQPWRIVVYHAILLPITAIGFHIFRWFWLSGYNFINYVFGREWLMGQKLTNVVGWATQVVNPLPEFQHLAHTLPFCDKSQTCCIASWNLLSAAGPLSVTEYIAGVIVAVFLFILMFSVFSYGLSILSVGETIIFTIFKKKSDDDNILEHQDEDEQEEEDDEQADFSEAKEED